jgi:LPXTG-motif cell wall-anchored protein
LIYHKLNGANVVALFPIFQSSPVTLITQENFPTLESLQNKTIELSTNELANISIKAIFQAHNITIKPTETKKEDKKKVNTGDHTQVMIYVAAIIISSLAVVLLKRKKAEN